MGRRGRRWRVLACRVCLDRRQSWRRHQQPQPARRPVAGVRKGPARLRRRWQGHSRHRRRLGRRRADAMLRPDPSTPRLAQPRPVVEVVVVVVVVRLRLLLLRPAVSLTSVVRPALGHTPILPAVHHHHRRRHPPSSGDTGASARTWLTTQLAPRRHRCHANGASSPACSAAGDRGHPAPRQPRRRSHRCVGRRRQGPGTRRCTAGDAPPLAVDLCGAPAARRRLSAPGRRLDTHVGRRCCCGAV